MDIGAQAQKLLDALAAKIDDLTTLDIETVVTGVSVTLEKDAQQKPTGGWTLLPAEDKPALGMRTRINLVDGDIKNLVSPELRTAEYKSLFDFHLEQVTKSHEIVAKNIETMVELAKKLIGSQQ